MEDVRRSTSNLDKQSEDGSESRSLDGSTSDQYKYLRDPVFEEEEFIDIRGIEIPTKIFDLPFYQFFAREKTIGEHLILLAAKPNLAFQADKCTLTTLKYCSYCCGSCFPDCENASHQVISTEKELLLNRKKRKLTNHTMIPADDLADVENQLSADQLNWFYEGLEADGVFQDFFPILAPILLNSEVVPPSLAHFTGPHIYLSRMTQRLLRELLNIQKKKEAERANEPVSIVHSPTTPGDDRRRQRRKKLLFEEISLNHYLNWRNANLCFNLVANPVNYSMNRFTLAAIHNHFFNAAQNASSNQSSSTHYQQQSKELLTFGGKLGQWPIDALPIQRLGPLPNSFQHHGTQGSLLKLFILHFNITDHPLMNVEERHSIMIRELFANYCQLFDQKLIELYSLQLQSLLMEMNGFLEKFHHSNANEEITEEIYAEIHHCYYKILDILPELTNLSNKIHGLTGKIYNEWRDIKEFRRRQTFISTSVNVRIKRLRSNLSAGGMKKLRGRDLASMSADLINSSLNNTNNNTANPTPRMTTIDSARTNPGLVNEWSNLCMQLERLPTNLKLMKGLLLKKREKLSETKEEEEVQEEEKENETDYYYQSNQEKTTQEWDREISILEVSANDIRSSNGLLPAFVLQLSENTNIITPDISLPSYEIRRRRRILATRFKLVVRLNGQVASSTYYQFMKYPDYILDFRCYLEMKVLKMPNDITIHVYMKGKNNARSKEIGLIKLPPPGAQTTSSLLKGAISSKKNMFSKKNGGSGGGGGGGSGAHHAVHTHANSSVYGGYEFASDILTQRSQYFPHHNHDQNQSSMTDLTTAVTSLFDKCVQGICGDSDMEYSERMTVRRSSFHDYFTLI
jgi:hypothetical protein